MTVRGSDVGRDVSMDDYVTYPVDVQAVLEATEDVMPKALSILGISPDDGTVTLGRPEIDEMIDEVEDEFGRDAGSAAARAVHWDEGWFDRDLFVEQASDLIRDSGGGYLVFSLGGTHWSGASGYKLADDIVDALSRDCETSFTVIGGSRGGKALKLRESSHDVPTGKPTYVIALTPAERDRLDGAGFDVVERFAEKHMD